MCYINNLERVIEVQKGKLKISKEIEKGRKYRKPEIGEAKDLIFLETQIELKSYNFARRNMSLSNMSVGWKEICVPEESDGILKVSET